MEEFPKLKKIDELPEFTPPNAEKKKSKKRRFLPLKILAGFIIIIALAGSLFSYRVLSVGSDVFVQFDDQKSSFLSSLNKLFLSNDKEVSGQKDGRTNILLLGMGGEGHTGAELTDTIILASISYDEETGKEKVALISIPRDLYVEYEDGYYSKINSVYSIGEREGENKGALLISQVVSTFTGVPIHYYVRVDFEGFRKVVDALGGVDVDVENGFIDKQYPTYNFGYQTIEFEKGVQQMDGETALQFSRSRHGVVTDGDGFEGSDFARARRQQRVLEAVKEKAFAVDTVVNPKKVNDLLGAVGDHARTNIQPWEMMIFLEMARDINKDEIVNQVLEHGDNGVLVSSRSNAGAYILLPRKKDFSEVKSLVRDVFNDSEDEQENFVEPEVVILNGTGIPGLAGKTKLNLSSKGYNVTDTGNASSTSYAQTIIYTSSQADNDSFSQSYAKIAQQLRDEFPSARIEEIPSINSLSTTPLASTTDIVIVIGKNAS